MKKIALALVVAVLSGCAIVPYGAPPPVYIGGAYHYHGYYGHGWRY